MSNRNYRYSWLLWHPHQGFWNWKLVRGVRKAIPIPFIHKAINYMIVQFDSLLLYIMVRIRRIKTLGFGSLSKNPDLNHGKKIVYLDLGTHKEGAELGLMVKSILPVLCKNYIAYGFEASGESHQIVQSKYKENQNIIIKHNAICHEIPEDGKLRLYKDMKGGVGDSIYRPSGHYEDVEAIRLSDFIKNNDFLNDNTIILLRMNIEGAEYDVIKDLVEAKISDRIAGYFGMWDDVSKIDIHRDDEFRAFLKKHGIVTLPFNGRDLNWNLRKKCIMYHMKTCVMKALKG